MLKFLYKGDPVNIMSNGRESAAYREVLPRMQKAQPTCMMHRLEKRVCLVSVQNIITVKSPHIQEVNTPVFCKVFCDGLVMHCDCGEANRRIHIPSDREELLASPCRKKFAATNKQECLSSKNTKLSDKAPVQSPKMTSESNGMQKPMCQVSPFKSPATQRVVNLKVSREAPFRGRRSVCNYEVNEGIRSISCDTDRSVDTVSEQKICNDVTPSSAGASENDDFTSVYRNKMQLPSVKSTAEKVLDPKVDSLITQANKGSAINGSSSIFCGIPKAKKCGIEVKSMDSLISSILSMENQKCHGMLLKRSSVLQERTNSPTSKLSDIHQTLDLKLGNADCDPPNSRFFLKDLEFEEEGETEDKENDVDKCTDISYRTVSKKYLKMKEANTKANEGYTTVITRKKAVIELFNCPKTYFRKSTRNRQVYFDANGWVSAHNDNPNIKSIYVEDATESNFEWDGEKGIVDIVKRVDLELEFD